VQPCRRLFTGGRSRASIRCRGCILGAWGAPLGARRAWLVQLHVRNDTRRRFPVMFRRHIHARGRGRPAVRAMASCLTPVSRRSNVVIGTRDFGDEVPCAMQGVADARHSELRPAVGRGCASTVGSQRPAYQSPRCWAARPTPAGRRTNAGRNFKHNEMSRRNKAPVPVTEATEPDRILVAEATEPGPESSNRNQVIRFACPFGTTTVCPGCQLRRNTTYPRSSARFGDLSTPRPRSRPHRHWRRTPVRATCATLAGKDTGSRDGPRADQAKPASTTPGA